MRNRWKTISTVAGAAVAVTMAATAALAQGTAPTATPSEQEQSQALYTAAKVEGGELTVYMGGDAPGQWDALATAFSQQFPDVRLHLVTDLSKYHDARIDNQLANHDLVADVAILQTTQDFDRWKRQGELLRYRPVGSGQVFGNAKDRDGYWTGVFYGAFSYIVNNNELTSDFTGTDLLAPEFKDKLILTYPNTNPDAFAKFMADRGAVERFRSQVELYVGKVEGADPADPQGTLGRTPGTF